MDRWQKSQATWRCCENKRTFPDNGSHRSKMSRLKEGYFISVLRGLRRTKEFTCIRSIWDFNFLSNPKWLVFVALKFPISSLLCDIDPFFNKTPKLLANFVSKSLEKNSSQNSNANMHTTQWKAIICSLWSTCFKDFRTSLLRRSKRRQWTTAWKATKLVA